MGPMIGAFRRCSTFSSSEAVTRLTVDRLTRFPTSASVISPTFRVEAGTGDVCLRDRVVELARPAAVPAEHVDGRPVLARPRHRHHNHSRAVRAWGHTPTRLTPLVVALLPHPNRSMMGVRTQEERMPRSAAAGHTLS
jgi:hypothetical protein